MGLADRLSAAIVHTPGLFHIGRAAYFVWAYPPNRGCTAHKHGAVQRRTTSALIPSRQRVVQGAGAWSRAAARPAAAGEAQGLQASGVHGRRRHVEYPTVADAVIKA